MATKVIKIEVPDTAIPLKRLSPGFRFPCEVFVKEGEETKALYDKGVLFTKSLQNELNERGVPEILIFRRDAANFESCLNGSMLSQQTNDESSVAAFKEYSYKKEQYRQIDSVLLPPGTKINFSLSVLDKFTLLPLIEGTDKDLATISDSVLNVAGDVVIKKSDVPRYLEYISALRQSSEMIKEDRSKIKAMVLRETSKIVLQDFFNDPRSGTKMRDVNTLVNDMIECIAEEKDSIYALLSLSGHDYYTYTHSVNVAALSVGIAVALGMDRDNTEKLGIGAIFHDVGKSQISHDILNKPARLTNVEFNLMKSHVVEGGKIMQEHNNFPKKSLSAILQHHEKLSCGGYPNGLCKNDIAIFGRITAIADCYDALTTSRPYKAAYSPFRALALISNQTVDYDPDIMKIFIKMLGKTLHQSD